MRPTNVLLVTKGHPFDHDAFMAVFDANPEIVYEHVEHPEAQLRLSDETLGDVDVVVFYDMPGLTFTKSDPPVIFEPPSESSRQGLRGLLVRGTPMVFMHHAIAGWPTWPEYAEIIGGRFHYQPAELGGVDYPDSGYRFDVTHTVDVVEPDHPICAGLPRHFELTDELYLFPVFEHDVIPVMRSRAAFTDEHFFSADLAIRGRRHSNDGWHHPPGSDLVAWVKKAGRSPIAYIQFGDGPVTYADPIYRRIVANAIAWAASKEAADWARL